MTQLTEPLAQLPTPGGRLFALPVGSTGVPEHLEAVDAQLHRTLAELQRQWAELGDGAPADILGEADLPELIARMLASGGKRLRPTMTYLGWAAAGGAHRTGRRTIVTISAALELLHLFALVHDDVMDESDSRRGVPTIHRQAADRHRTAGALGDSELFGTSIAILVGDLALAEADGLVAALPAEVRSIWRQLVVELVVGQRQDVAGTAARRRTLSFARTVATLKSGRYTVQRPLELGAVAAGAPAAVQKGLTRYGEAVGEAFALRDDILGLWGDPERTGKPAGDDLITGKPTVLLALAADRVRTSAARAALDRVGSPEFADADLPLLLDELNANGTRTAVEAMIRDAVTTALDALDLPLLEPDAVDQLRRLAHAVAWRER